MKITKITLIGLFLLFCLTPIKAEAGLFSGIGKILGLTIKKTHAMVKDNQMKLGVVEGDVSAIKAETVELNNNMTATMTMMNQFMLKIEQTVNLALQANAQALGKLEGKIMVGSNDLSTDQQAQSGRDTFIGDPKVTYGLIVALVFVVFMWQKSNTAFINAQSRAESETMKAKERKTQMYIMKETLDRLELAIAQDPNMVMDIQKQRNISISGGDKK